jgi:hypothetical protein
MKYALINDKGQVLEIVNCEKVFRDMATFPKGELKQLLKDQELFIDVADRLEDLAVKGYLKKYGVESPYDRQVYTAVKAFIEVLKDIIKKR